MPVRLAFPRRLLLRAPTTWVLGQALLASRRKKRPLATPWSHLLWVPLQRQVPRLLLMRTWSPVVRAQSPNLQCWLVALLGGIPLPLLGSHRALRGLPHLSTSAAFRSLSKNTS